MRGKEGDEEDDAAKEKDDAPDKPKWAPVLEVLEDEEDGAY